MGIWNWLTRKKEIKGTTEVSEVFLKDLWDTYEITFIEFMENQEFFDVIEIERKPHGIRIYEFKHKKLPKSGRYMILVTKNPNNYLEIVKVDKL